MFTYLPKSHPLEETNLRWVQGVEGRIGEPHWGIRSPEVTSWLHAGLFCKSAVSVSSRTSFYRVLQSLQTFFRLCVSENVSILPLFSINNKVGYRILGCKWFPSEFWRYYSIITCLSMLLGRLKLLWFPIIFLWLGFYFLLEYFRIFLSLVFWNFMMMYYGVFWGVLTKSFVLKTFNTCLHYGISYPSVLENIHKFLHW